MRRTFGRLALDVARAHVHDAGEAEQGGDRRRRDAVLAGTGLGDQALFTEPFCKQTLAKHVVDLVGAGVRQIFALQVQPNIEIQLVGESIRPINGRWPAGEAPTELAQLGPERRVTADGRVCRLQLEQRGHQRLGHVPTAQIAL